MIKLRVMTWNIDFGSRKEDFIPSDPDRANKVLEFVDRFNIEYHCSTRNG